MLKNILYITSSSVLLIIGILTGCKTGREAPRDTSPSPDMLAQGAPCEYARGFQIQPNEEGMLLTLLDPASPNTVLYRIEISSSYQRIVASSTTHVAFISALQAHKHLAGSTNPQRIYDSTFSRKLSEGAFLDLGRDMEYNLEALISANPDLVLMTGFEGQSSTDQRLRELGIPVLHIREWMEPHPLGRAEWIKVFGLLTGRQESADSLFNLVKERYLALQQMADTLGPKPKVLSGNDFRGTWYMPARNNFMSRFYQDAGIFYPGSDQSGTASRSLSFESVLDEYADADLWVGVPVNSLDELIASDQRYLRFRAVQTGRVYSVNRRVTAQGANDFWERGVVRPDEILSDLLRMAYPSRFTSDSLHYYLPLTSRHAP